MATIQKQPTQQNMVKPKPRFEQSGPNLETIFTKATITRCIILKMNEIGKNISQTLENKIKEQFEGKCFVEGYIKPNSSKIITYSSGVIDRGDNISFTVVIQCDLCFPVEGMLLQCEITNVTRAGITAKSSIEKPSPITVFISRDYHYDNKYFTSLNIGEIITVSVIGQRFELNDNTIYISGKLIQKNVKKM